MPAISRRRGSAASFFGGLAGLPFCSAGNLRTGSAIPLFFLWGFAGRILDRVAHVFLDRFQLGEQAMRVGRVDAVERRRGEFGTGPCEFPEQGGGGLAKKKAVDPPVGFVATAFDPVIVTKLVDQSR